MAPERDEALYLVDLRDAVERILRYTAAGRDAFLADPMIQDAVIRNLEVMGEAVRRVSADTRSAHPEIPWRQIAGTRDRVIHGYFTVDLEIVWEIVEAELPTLHQRLAALAPDDRSEA
jgi:uncharacterized protein with HEPN domain